MTIITGNTADNVLTGTTDDDVLRGLAGTDTLQGNGGNDVLEGGDGSDTAVYAGSQPDYQLEMTADHQVRVNDFNLADGNDGTDTLQDIETVQFADRAWQVWQRRETQVNTSTNSYQFMSTAAGLPDGGYVVTWMSYQNGATYDIYGQRYDRYGAAAGGEFLVSSTPASHREYPTIASLPDGGFVVTWMSDGQDGSGFGCYGQRFDSSGVMQGAEFQINTYVPDPQYMPVVAGLKDGGFAVAWMSLNQDGSGWGVYSQRFDAQALKSGGETLVNGQVYGEQYQPAITALGNGGYVVTWMSNPQDGSDYGIYARLFDAGGVALGAEFLVNTCVDNSQQVPDVAALADGGFGVTWMSYTQDGAGWGIYAQRFSQTGAVIGAEFQVNSTSLNHQMSPAITALADGGFVVTWESDDGSNNGVYGRRFDQSGVALGGEFRINSYVTGNQFLSDVAALADGGFVVTWTSDGQDGSIYGVYSQRYDAMGNTVGLVGSNLDDVLDLSASAGGLSIESGAGNDTLTGGVGSDVLDGGEGADTVVLAGTPADYEFVVTTRTHMLATDTNPANGSEGRDLLKDIETLQFADREWQISTPREFQINTTTANAQTAPSVSTLNDGGSVVVWVSAVQDGSGAGIYGQRYDSNGDAAGTEFRINSTTANDQRSPAVTQLADGGFLVTWVSALQDGALGGIYGQRYDGAGATVDSEFRINTTTANDQDWTTATGLAGGGFVVSWMCRNQDGSGWGIYGQVFSDTGVEAGGEFRINSITANQQQLPTLAALADGGFVALWSSYGQDGSGWGIYGQRYAASGAAQGGEFTVNAVTGGNQWYPVVTGLADGGFVAAWSSYAQDGSGEGIFCQRFDANGVEVGGSFQANTFVARNQERPSVTALSDGGFVLTWMSSGQDGAGEGLYGRRYNATGVAGSEFRINDTTAADQTQAVVAALPDGGFQVIWSSAGQDGSGSGIYGKRFGSFGDAPEVQGSSLDDVMNFSGSLQALTLAGGEGNDALTGGLGNDRLVGGTGADSLAGRQGDDAYFVDDAADTVTELSGEGTDTVYAPLSQTLADNVENLILTGADSINGTGNSLDNSLTGNSGNNLLDGGDGTDSLVGGAGDDTYVVYNPGDLVLEQAGGGTDLVLAAISHVLADEVENLTLTGIDSINGTGNALDNVLTGNSGDNLLDGAAGADALNGGLGNDAYVVDAVGDQVVESDGEGTDLVQASLSWTLASGVENLELTGSGDINGTGNALDNRLTGNAGDNLLDGGAGEDTVVLGGLPEGYRFGVDASGALTVTDIQPADGDTGTDTLRQVEHLQFSDRSWTIHAASAPGAEFRVNTTTAGSQELPVITALADGGYVVLWRSNDGAGWGVYGQRYAADDTPVGAEFGVNATTSTGAPNDTGFQWWPSVTGLADGGFVAVWMSFGQAGGANHEIIGQRFDVLSQRVGSEFLVNTTVADEQYYPTVTDLTGGGFVATWMSYDQDGSGWGLFGRSFDSSGTPTGGEFAVNSTTFSTQMQSAVTALPDGGFMVAWMTYQEPANDMDIIARRFDAAGQPASPEFRVNATVPGNQSFPTLAALANGNVAICWFDTAGANDIAVRLINADGSPLGGEIHIPAVTQVTSQSVSVTALADGGFVVTWGNHEPAGLWVYGQQFDDTGVPVGASFRVNTTEFHNQFFPAVAGLADGSFVVAWNADILDGSVLGIQARHFPSTTNSMTGSALADVMDFSDSTAGLRLDGGAGDDVLTGGSGLDTARFSAAWRDSTVSGDAVLATVSSSDGNDTLAGIEFLSFAGVVVATAQAVNDAPVAVADGNGADAVVEIGSVVAGDAQATGNLLANDTDADIGLGLGESLTISEVEGSAANLGVTLTGTCGQVVINSDGSWLYTLDNGDADTEALAEGQTVTEVFAYTVTDLHGAVSSASLSVAVHGSNDGPGLAPVSALTYTDTAVDDVFAAQGGSLAGTDPENNSLSYSISGGVDQGNGTTIQAGLYGTLTVNHITGDYSFTPTDAAIEPLGADASESFTLTVSDGLLSTGQDLTIHVVQSGATETSGNDTLTGTAGNDTICAMAGDDLLDGGDGIDTLKGGLGNDTYLVDTLTDVIVENSSAGTDTISTGLSFTLSSSAMANVENLTLTGVTDAGGTGNALNNVLTGNSGNNILDGRVGADTMIGGIGNDRYYVDNIGDVVTELSGEGEDYIYARIDHALGANIERLYLIEGSAGLTATGNTLANVITGNSAANVLTGGLGNDLLVGAAGNDTYRFARGDNADTVKDNDSTAGNTDVLSFLSGVAYDQLWFRQFGSSLLINVIGANDKVTIQDWYSSANNHVEQIRTVDGNHVLLDSQVQSLVSAMAAMSVPTTTTLTVAQHAALDAVIAASWS